MTLNKLFILLCVITAIIFVVCYIGIFQILTIRQVDTTQDEKEWATGLQEERERQFLEAGAEAFERLDKIYGNPPLTD
jgi:hypothetical protein